MTHPDVDVARGTETVRVNRILASDGVRILWRTHNLINARVRDASGIYDVQWVLLGGARSSCTCRTIETFAADEVPGCRSDAPIPGGCEHMAAVLRLTRYPLVAPEGANA